jgi:succinate dehydrogenase/fumarate reductase flavoprotein subunit
MGVSAAIPSSSDASSHAAPAGSAERHCDVLVIGSGAGGLSAAVTAAHLGLDVVLADKDDQLGGTTAWSGGWMWIPRNPLALEAGIQEDPSEPLRYLQHELGDRFDAPRVEAFLQAGPRMVDFFRRHTALQFIPGHVIPDFHGRSPGAATGGRSVCAAPFDGRRLGSALSMLKPPLWETTLWGMGIASGAELRHFFQALRAPASFAYVARCLARHAADLLRFGRGTRLVNGNALVAALLRSALDRGVTCLPGSPAVQLLTAADSAGGGSRVSGAVLSTSQGPLTVHARRGVVLACGGFPHDPQRKAMLLPHAPTGREHWSAANRGNTGDGLRMAEAASAVVSDDMFQAAALAPVSLVPRDDGSVAHFPHLIERGKPGLIAVTADGRRFTNEADSYHDFMQGLLRATPSGQAPKAWLVVDHAFIRTYGLGAVKPFPMRLGPWLRKGYLKRGRTWAELAAQCGISRAGLEQTVARYREMALQGVDSDFGKGETAYNRMQGDAARAQAQGCTNPCMAPLGPGPFYAVQVVPGSLGTFAGLRVNAQAQVLAADGQAIAGLFAAGNDMSSVMQGHYPSGGITLGPAMTFGYIVGHVLAGRPWQADPAALSN